MNIHKNTTGASGQAPRRSGAEFVHGYQSGLIRTELKQALRKFREEHHLNDTHIERCLTSACIELALRNVYRPELMELLRIAISKDFEANFKPRLEKRI